MRTKLIKFFRDESGASAVEYSLVAGGIAFAIIAVTELLGMGLSPAISTTSSSVK
jgi:pilus assembly protein Flp/PilA